MKIVSVGDISEQVRGVSYSKSESSDEPRPGYVAVLRANNITDEGLTSDQLVYVPAARVSTKQRIVASDVVIATSSGSLSVVGKAAQARQAIDGSFGAFCKVLRPNGKVDPLYFGHFFRTPAYRRTVSALAAGANINNLKNEHLDNLAIRLPPLPEQKRIAAILDAADALRVKRRESIEQLDLLTHAHFQEMFGDPVENPMGWRKAPLGEIMRIRRGGSPRPIDKYLGGTVNWVKISDATGSDNDLYITSCVDKISEAGLCKTTLLEPGSFIFANSGVSLGFARILKLQGAIHDGWLAFDEYSTDQLSPLFFLKALNSITHYFRRIAPAGTQPNLNTSLMKAFELILPPIDLQDRFAALVELIESHKTRLKAQYAELESLFACLQFQAFSGELCSGPASRQHASA
jgi:type I restriction enzyme S subunit